jgi:hypothetical protein
VPRVSVDPNCGIRADLKSIAPDSKEINCATKKSELGRDWRCISRIIDL